MGGGQRNPRQRVVSVDTMAIIPVYSWHLAALALFAAVCSTNHLCRRQDINFFLSTFWPWPWPHLGWAKCRRVRSSLARHHSVRMWSDPLLHLTPPEMSKKKTICTKKKREKGVFWFSCHHVVMSSRMGWGHGIHARRSRSFQEGPDSIQSICGCIASKAYACKEVIRIFPSNQSLLLDPTSCFLYKQEASARKMSATIHASVDEQIDCKLYSSSGTIQLTSVLSS